MNNLNQNFLDKQRPPVDIKRHLFITGLIILGLFVYMNYFGEKPVQETTPQQTAQTNTPPSNNTSVATTPSATTPMVALKSFYCPPMRDSDLEITINATTGTIDSAILLNYLTDGDFKPIPMFAHFPQKGAFSATFGLPTVEPVVSTHNKTIILTRQYADFKTVESFTLEGQYKIGYKISIENTSAAPLKMPDLTLSTGPVEPELYLSNDQAYGSIHNIVGLATDSTLSQADATADDEDFNKVFNHGKGGYEWVAVQNKYCAAILKSGDFNTPFRMAVPERFKQVGKDAKEYQVLTAKGVWTFDTPVNAGEKIERTATLYAGPKLLNSLESFDGKYVEAMKLSYFSWFEFIARYMLRILLWIHDNIIADYGMAIIILTVGIKACFWHLQTKATLSMRKMQTIQPKMKEIQEKYKENRQLQQEKMMELYRTEGVNPASGCLPLLLQMPIYIALFAALNGAVELRQTSFLWINDLSRPDAVAVIFGLPIHPLILAQTALMILQQMFTPASGDKTQRYMMYLMPMVILIFFYNMPAGLTLYMTISSIPQIIQQWYMLKHHPVQPVATENKLK